MTNPTLLIVAKAPVPGLAKTRIARTIGDEAAAELAAAALLDTLDAASAVGWPLVVAMTGEIAAAARTEELVAALGATTVIAQRGDGLGERLAYAHADADQGHGVVQVGMDTPQITVENFFAAGRHVEAGHRTIGLADDGGWWLLGLPNGGDASALVDVPMSHADTGSLTEAAFGEIKHVAAQRDMDTWEDAQAIAADLPISRLAAVVGTIA